MRPAQLGSAQLSSVQAQKRAAQRRAVPCCRALPCGAVLRRAMLSFEHVVYRMRSKYQVPKCTSVLVFLVSSLVVLPLGRLRV